MSEVEAQADALECLIEAGRIRQVLEILDSVGDECVMHIGSDGLQSSFVGPSNVYMVNLTLEPRAFADTGSGSWPIGVNIKRFVDYLSKADDETLVSLSFDGETRKMHIQYDGVDATMASIDPDAIRNEPDVSELDLPNRCVVDGEVLHDAMEMADLVSDHVEIACHGDTMTVAADGDADDIEIRFGFDDQYDLLEGSKITDETSSLFSLEFTKDATDVIPDGETVEFVVGADFPWKAWYDIADGDGEVVALIAPRIQTK